MHPIPGGAAAHLSPGRIRAILKPMLFHVGNMSGCQVEISPIHMDCFAAVFRREGGEVASISFNLRGSCIKTYEEGERGPSVKTRVREVEIVGGESLNLSQFSMDKVMGVSARITHPDLPRKSELTRVPLRVLKNGKRVIALYNPQSVSKGNTVYGKEDGVKGLPLKRAKRGKSPRPLAGASPTGYRKSTRHADLRPPLGDEVCVEWAEVMAQYRVGEELE